MNWSTYALAGRDRGHGDVVSTNRDIEASATVLFARELDPQQLTMALLDDFVPRGEVVLAPSKTRERGG
jgi:hypothetical protein